MFTCYRFRIELADVVFNHVTIRVGDCSSSAAGGWDGETPVQVACDVTRNATRVGFRWEHKARKKVRSTYVANKEQLLHRLILDNGTVMRVSTGLFSWNDATLFLPLVLFLNYLFCLQVLKFYPIRLSFIFFAFSNFNPGEHQSAEMTTTHKGPNMQPSKVHVSLWRPSILQKRLWLIWVISLHQSVCQVPKNSKRMHQEWPCVVGVAQGRGLRPYIGGAECLVCQLHCARLGKGFWGLCGYIESVCSEGICRSWKN